MRTGHDGPWMVITYRVDLVHCEVLVSLNVLTGKFNVILLDEMLKSLWLAVSAGVLFGYSILE